MNIVLAAETGSGYVAAAFLVFLAVLMIYLVIMAKKLSKLQASTSEIRQKLEAQNQDEQ